MSELYLPYQHWPSYWSSTSQYVCISFRYIESCKSCKSCKSPSHLETLRNLRTLKFKSNLLKKFFFQSSNFIIMTRKWQKIYLLYVLLECHKINFFMTFKSQWMIFFFGFWIHLCKLNMAYGPVSHLGQSFIESQIGHAVVLKSTPCNDIFLSQIWIHT